MTSIWQGLMGNLASIAFLIAMWMHVYYKLYRLTKLQVKIGLGLVTGMGTVVSMLMAVQVESGVFFDLRYSLIAVSAVFGGPPAIVVTTTLAACFRFALGGAGASWGIETIVLVALVCTIAYFTMKSDRATQAKTGIATTIVGILSIAFFAVMKSGRFDEVAIPIALLNTAATALIGTTLVYFERFTQERDVLRAALGQAPDYHYVKNLKSEIMATNLNVARINGRARSSEMIGLTDYDLTSAKRAAILYEAEQAVMRTGQAMNDVEEFVTDPKGLQRWFRTSKVPLRNRQGDLIGIAGVSRDVTVEKELERDLLTSRNLLSQAMAEMSDGFAMFDANGTLLFCNDKYRSFYPLSAPSRQPGSNISDILRMSITSGERADIGPGISEQELANAAAMLFADGDNEVPLSSGRWLSVRTRLGQDGCCLVLITDITEAKHSELSLRQLAERMKGLAETDALTGLSNRRAFEQSMADHWDGEDARPVSLVMIDVDRFKAYNDTYGHPAGDQCLAEVSQCLRAIVGDEASVVARIGGEEFVAMLTGTDSTAALEIAERFRATLQGRGLKHEASEFGLVTASVGVATTSISVLKSSELLKLVDVALYRAKQSGRNRTVAINEFGPRLLKTA